MILSMHDQIRHRIAPVSLALLLLAAACADGVAVDPTPAATAPAGPGPAATSTAPASPDTTATSTTSTSPDPTSDGATLGLADLPEGWQEVPAEALGADGTGPCIDALLAPGGPFDAGAGVASSAFAESRLGAFLIIATVRPADPAATLADVEQHVADCDGQTDAAGFTTTIEPADAPDIGEAAVAFRGTAEGEVGARVDYLLVSARTAQAVVLVVQVVALGELDPALVADAAATMAARAG